jgi:hypothetical protein
VAPQNLFCNNFVLTYAGCMVDAIKAEFSEEGASVATISAWILGNKIASDLDQSGVGNSLRATIRLEHLP